MTSPRHHYPQSERLAECIDQHRTITEFLEWANSQGYQLAAFQSGGPGSVAFMFPVTREAKERIIHQFLDIDTKALEQERQDMIRYLQQSGAA